MELWGMPLLTSLAFYVLLITVLTAVLWTIITGLKNRGKDE